jgi:nucleoside-diphosphate-sugar epimerase
MKVLIVGCGYVGMALGARLASQGHAVFGLRRTASGRTELEPLGIQLLTADVTQPETLARLPGEWSWVVNTVSAGGGGGAAYETVYCAGMRHLVTWLRTAAPALSKFVYTSSTGVYAQDDGSEVTEESEATPTTATGRSLLEAEQVLLSAHRDFGFPAVILRAAGIYGPGRGYWLRQFLAGEARLEGKGERILNMIHRDDLAGIIAAALERGLPGEIYNAVDEEPVSQTVLFGWLAKRLNRQMPTQEPPATIANSRRTATNKSVSSRKLRQRLRYQFNYPTFREGFEAELTGHSDA